MNKICNKKPNFCFWFLLSLKKHAAHLLSSSYKYFNEEAEDLLENTLIHIFSSLLDFGKLRFGCRYDPVICAICTVKRLVMVLVQ